ncbi:hypothetical protein QBC38DRAFT_488358 [Podospora fimiseda]|uniref:Uncharacterized protein n=1 Tax=Podospora fimiseda TaxID=252190 RepID=A0AAN7GWC8_9PEZI|nr:hypothetical protein QBC38DRAFT_488358 [Podospora fimiseda]
MQSHHPEVIIKSLAGLLTQPVKPRYELRSGNFLYKRYSKPRTRDTKLFVLSPNKKENIGDPSQSTSETKPKMTDHHHRGRRRYDEVYEPTYTEYHETRPRRHRSLGRQVLDKLEDAMAGLGIDDGHKSHHHSSHHHHSSSRNHHHSPHRRHHHHHSSTTSHPHHHHRRAHSSSPTRRRHRSHSTHYTTTSRTPRSRATRSRSRGHSRAPSRSRSRVDKGLKAAAQAGAIEAFRVRKEPGGWIGPKGSRVATAAISAGVIGAAAEKRNQDRDGDTKMPGTKGSALAGMMVSRLVNGPKRDLRG